MLTFGHISGSQRSGSQSRGSTSDSSPRMNNLEQILQTISSENSGGQAASDAFQTLSRSSETSSPESLKNDGVGGTHLPQVSRSISSHSPQVSDVTDTHLPVTDTHLPVTSLPNVSESLGTHLPLMSERMSPQIDHLQQLLHMAGQSNDSTELSTQSPAHTLSQGSESSSPQSRGEITQATDPEESTATPAAGPNTSSGSCNMYSCASL